MPRQARQASGTGIYHVMMLWMKQESVPVVLRWFSTDDDVKYIVDTIKENIIG